MALVPYSHITDAHKLTADAEIELFELTPAVGSGTFRFKNDNDETWLGNLYTGMPLQFTGETFNAEGRSSQPSLVIGQTNIDLSVFKPLIATGAIDGARIDKHTVLLSNITNNLNIKVTRTYRVKRVEGYSSSVISLVLATFSPAGPSTLPFREFIPPAFPFVRLT